MTLSVVENGPGNQPFIRRIISRLRWILRAGSAASLTTAAVLAAQHGSAAVTISLAVLAPVLFLTAAGVDQVVPRFLPEPLRTLTRQSLFDAEATRVSAKVFRRGSGVPKRTAQAFAGDVAGTPFAARPKSLYQRACTEVLWTGDSIAITDRRGSVTTWRTTNAGVISDFLPAVLKSPHRVPVAPPTGDAVVAGLVVARTKTRPIDLLILIDRRSRRVGAAPVTGFEEKDLATVAEQAGLEFSAYVLPTRFGRDGEALTAAMFPRSVRFRRIAGVQHEWGPLKPLQTVVHYWLGTVIDELEAPMVSRRAVKQAAKRPM